jgi:glycerophosphoryl diester phosphodiesterase
MLASCGEVVVIHDETIDRTTNGNGFVYDYSYEQLKNFSAGVKFNSFYEKERIPSLIETIYLLRELKLVPNIEIKAIASLEHATVINVLKTLADHWPAELPKPLISSFSISILNILRENCATAQLGFLMHEWNPDWLSQCQRLNCSSVNVNVAILSPERIAAIKAENYVLLVYTVNNIIQARELLSLGVDAVFSDCPINFKF